MPIFIIPFWIPIAWALFVAYRQRTSWHPPLNSWLTVALVFALNYLFFKYCVIIFILIEIIRRANFTKLKKTKKNED
jgi:hypothetical protein